MEPKEESQTSIPAEGVRVSCKCKRSMCLKLYCECFSRNLKCGSDCACTGCHNTSHHESERNDVIDQCLQRDSNAFYRAKIPPVNKHQIPSVGSVDSSIGEHSKDIGTDGQGNPSSTEDRGESSTVDASTLVPQKRGCNCRKTGCSKRYCECFNNGVQCTDACDCYGCKNGKCKPGSNATVSPDTKERQRSRTRNTQPYSVVLSTQTRSSTRSNSSSSANNSNNLTSTNLHGMSTMGSGVSMNGTPTTGILSRREFATGYDMFNGQYGTSLYSNLVSPHNGSSMVSTSASTPHQLLNSAPLNTSDAYDYDDEDAHVTKKQRHTPKNGTNTTLPMTRDLNAMYSSIQHPHSIGGGNLNSNNALGVATYLSISPSPDMTSLTSKYRSFASPSQNGTANPNASLQSPQQQFPRNARLSHPTNTTSPGYTTPAMIKQSLMSAKTTPESSRYLFPSSTNNPASSAPSVVSTNTGTNASATNLEKRLNTHTPQILSKNSTPQFSALRSNTHTQTNISNSFKQNLLKAQGSNNGIHNTSNASLNGNTGHTPYHTVITASTLKLEELAHSISEPAQIIEEAVLRATSEANMKVEKDTTNLQL